MNAYHAMQDKYKKHLIALCKERLSALSDSERQAVMSQYPNAGKRYGDSEGALEAMQALAKKE